jgi:hypothetical protein
MSSEQRWIGGIDEPLPAGEVILWKGAPEPRAVARHVVHERGWMLYLSLLTVGVIVSAAGTRPLGDVLKLMVPPALLMGIAWLSIRAFSRAVARTTEYILTTRRLILRAGIAFPIAINIPLRLVDEAGLRVFGDGSGELQLRLSDRVKLAYIALWPHVETLRHLAHPRPKLRGLADPQAVGAALRDALAAEAASEGSAVTMADTPAHDAREATGGVPFRAPNRVLAQ